MKKTLIILSQSYLQFSSEEVINHLMNELRLVLIIHHSEKIHSILNSQNIHIYRVDGVLEKTIKPELNISQITEIVEKEIEMVGSYENLAIFCQEEDNVLTAAEIRDKFNILGDMPEMVLKFRNKVVMKENIKSKMPEILPKYETLDPTRIITDPDEYYNELTSKLGNKLIIKPTAGAGSFNVMTINTLNDFQDAGEMIKNDRHVFHYEVDEYISGKMYQCDSFIKNGKVIFCGILELGCTNLDFVHGKPLSVYPVDISDFYIKLFDYNQSIITTLGFENGSTHHEFFIEDGTQKIIFLEIAARIPGGIGVPFHSANSGINLIDANLLMAAESPMLQTIQPKMENNVVSALLPVGNGTIVSLNEPDISSPYTINWRVNVADEVHSHSLIDNAGILTFKNDDKEVLRNDFERLQSWTPVTCTMNEL